MNATTTTAAAIPNSFTQRGVSVGGGIASEFYETRGHRRAVREATLDAAAALVAEHGVRGVTMQQIAERAGIGRATLYEYFPDVESILHAWHERHVHAHVAELAALAHGSSSPAERLVALLDAYASMQHEHPSADELVTYCLHALAGARTLRSKAAVRRLVQITIDGLRMR